MNLPIDDPIIRKIQKDVAGEIIFSEEPGKVFKQWRESFKISQKELAQKLNITSSVVCDYESGRRKSPGTKIIKKYIEAILDIDQQKGGEIIKQFTKKYLQPQSNEEIFQIKEFFNSIRIKDFCDLINAELLTPAKPYEIYGYTITNSLRAISEIPFDQLIKIYGSTTQRALVFTKVSTGRTPMVAIKLTNLKPSLVVLHGENLKEIDPLGIEIAKKESIPLAICRLEKESEIHEKLKKLE